MREQTYVTDISHIFLPRLDLSSNSRMIFDFSKVKSAILLQKKKKSAVTLKLELNSAFGQINVLIKTPQPH